MITLIYDRNKIKDYKQFYEDFAKHMDAKNDMNCLDPENLSYNPNHLWEFLTDFYDETFTFIFKNFNLDAIEDGYNRKNYEDYNWKIIFEVFKEFVEKYPQNKLEFKEN